MFKIKSCLSSSVIGGLFETILNNIDTCDKYIPSMFYSDCDCDTSFAYEYEKIYFDKLMSILSNIKKCDYNFSDDENVFLRILQEKHYNDKTVY